MLLLCIFKQVFVPHGWTLKRVGVKFLTPNRRTKRTCTMSLDGSPKAKIVYGQSSKILFKQKWIIPKVYSFSPFLAGPNLPLESAKYC